MGNRFTRLISALCAAMVLIVPTLAVAASPGERGPRGESERRSLSVRPEVDADSQRTRVTQDEWNRRHRDALKKRSNGRKKMWWGTAAGLAGVGILYFGGVREAAACFNTNSNNCGGGNTALVAGGVLGFGGAAVAGWGLVQKIGADIEISWLLNNPPTGPPAPRGVLTAPRAVIARISVAW